MKREIVPLGMRNWREGREIEVGDEKLSHCEVECIVGEWEVWLWWKCESEEP